MGVNTYRVIAIVIAIKILMSLVILTAVPTFSGGEVDTFFSQGEENWERTIDGFDDKTVDTENLYIENQVGDLSRIAKGSFLNPLSNGLLWLSTNWARDSVEEILIYVINIFIMVINGFLAFELYQLIRGKNS